MKRVVLLLLATIAGLMALPLLMNGRTEKVHQGWVEADLLFIGPDTTGRLTRVEVDEGATVARGAPLFQLDDTAARATLAARRAVLAGAEAQLDQAKAAQKRPQEIAILDASRRQAEAELSLAEQELKRIRALAASGTASRANLDAAIAAEAASRAALDNVRGQITLAAMPARDEAIAQAAENLRAAQADVAMAEDTLDRLSASAPADGTVQTVYFRAGEVVPAGRPIVALLDPANIRVRFFVAETEIALVSLGQTVRIGCDACEPTTARISFISDSAEYTPPEIYSLEERAKLVYRVEAIPEAPETLRPGLPVDVVVKTGEAAK